LKGINTPWKKTLLASLSNGNWLAVYQDLLYRIEFWAENKVLSYTKQDLNTITDLVRKVGLPVVAQECVKKYVTSPDQSPVPAQIAQAKMDEVTYFPDAEENTNNSEEENAVMEAEKCATKAFGILKLEFIKDIKAGKLKGWKNLFSITNDLSYFDNTNPTDTIYEIVQDEYSEMSDFEFSDGNEFVEKVLEFVEDKFIKLSEKATK
jgi:hypothetical protein